MYKLIFFSMFIIKAMAGNDTLPEPPSRYFNFSNWKLQVPGPKEIKDLNGYTSDYFYLAADTSLCFDLNAAEKGTTKNAHYVRSELRHLLNWETGSPHSLSARIRISCNLPAYQVTVMQIHGINVNKDDAPPLLRIAVVNGDLYAYLKSDSTGAKTEKKLLLSNVSDKYFSTVIKLENAVLTVTVNGKDCLRKELPFWNYLNYFKLGCYPQETEGNFKVYIKNFAVS